MLRPCAAMTLLALLAVTAMPRTATAQNSTVEASNPDELLAAINDKTVASIRITKPMVLPTSWGPAIVTRPIAVSSVIRAVIDFCNDPLCDDEAAWPTSQAPRFIVRPGGQLSFNRLFFRHWIPPVSPGSAHRRLLAAAPASASAANGSSLDFTNSPVPFIESAGGDTSYYLVVLHFTPNMTWVFGNSTLAPNSWWQAAVAATALLSLNANGGQPLQLHTPDLYNLKKFTVDGHALVTDCYLPVDLRGCYSYQPFDEQLIYCPFTLRDSLKNPYLRTVHMFHNIGLDRLVWQPWTRSSLIMTHPVVYQPCPGTNLTIDFENVTESVTVGPGGQLSFRDITVRGSKVGNRTGWPGEIPLLLSPFAPVGGGSVSLVNVTMQVNDADALARTLALLPAGNVGAPEFPDLHPTYAGGAPKLSGGPPTSNFTVSSWRLLQQQWLSYSGDPAAATSAGGSSWVFRDVRVQERHSVDCYRGSLLLGSATYTSICHVKTSAELLSALANGTVRYIQVDGDISVTSRDSPVPLPITVSRFVEVRACNADHSPYIINWNDEDDIVMVASTLIFNGDLLMRGLGWEHQGAQPLQVVDALHPLTGGIIEVEDLTLEGVLPEAGQGADAGATTIAQMLAVPGMGQLQANLTQTATTEITFHSLLVNSSAHSLMDTHGAALGSFSFIDATLHWQVAPPLPTGAAPLSTGAIAGIVVGVAALIAGAAALACLLARRRRAAALPPPGVTAKPMSDVEFGSAQLKPSASYPSGPFGSSGLLKVGSADGASSTPSGHRPRSGPSNDIADACRELAVARMAGDAPAADGDTLVLEAVLGEGSYGKVYKGYWKGTVVAVKIMLLPSYMTGKEKREKMAVMETAISSSLSHPNIVQTYTYAVEPVKVTSSVMTSRSNGGPNTGKTHLSLHDSTCSMTMRQDHGVRDVASAESQSWEVRLVQEYCDKGTLRDALSCQEFHARAAELLAGGDTGAAPPAPSDCSAEPAAASVPPHMLLMLDTALDVARAMAHLHSQNIVHSDLKARNVLLKASFSDWRSFVAKVADFGLSLRLDPNDTHMSNMYQGTMTHMAPETLMFGHIGKASDVYAFGILLWELYTGAHAHRGMPRALLGHNVAKQGLRPRFPNHAPFELQLLACRCWESDPTIRPTFDQVLEELKRLRAALAAAPAKAPGAAAADSLALQSVLRRLDETEEGMEGNTLSTDGTQDSDWIASAGAAAAGRAAAAGEAAAGSASISISAVGSTSEWGPILGSMLSTVDDVSESEATRVARPEDH